MENKKVQPKLSSDGKFLKLCSAPQGSRSASAITPTECKKNPTMRHQSQRFRGGALQPNGLIGRATQNVQSVRAID
jgi:hypothetical protein